MKPFIFNQWHAWAGVAGVILSNEATKKMHSFKNPDCAINWLFLNGDKPAARALNKHVKGEKA